MKLLLIEDDQNIIRTLSLALREMGFIVDAASDGERGEFLALTNKYDALIVDYNLPKISGREIVKKIRELRKNTPILMLTVRSELKDKVDLLNLGADDYLTKPFALSELLARIKAILRRPANQAPGLLTLADLELDPDKFLVTKNKKRIVLTTKEFSLLEYFLRNKGRVLSRQEIMENVWDENADPFSNTIEVHIMNLRKKIESDGRHLIFSVSSRGYKIDEQK